MRLTVLHSDTPEGVTFCHVPPPSFVSWIFPSSVPTQIRPSLISDGAIVRIVPSICFGFFSAARVRVRSGLTACQLVPASAVFKRNCVPRYSRCGSCGEKSSGIVQLKRYLLPNETGGGGNIPHLSRGFGHSHHAP